MLKNWPKNKFDFLNYEEVIRPIKKTILEAYRMVRKDVKFVPYDGYTFGDFDLSYFRNPEMLMNQCMNKWGRFKDKSPLDVMLFTIFWLGVEQGRRFERNNLTAFSEENFRQSSESTSFMDFLRKEAKHHNLPLDKYIENVAVCREQKVAEEDKRKKKK
jgi:hypothetical protein